MNPGPYHFPCSVCTCPVRSDQRGIKCDNCLPLCHVLCGDVHNYQYQEIMGSEFFLVLSYMFTVIATYF